jgi:hypothetical protein
VGCASLPILSDKARVGRSCLRFAPAFVSLLPQRTLRGLHQFAATRRKAARKYRGRDEKADYLEETLGEDQPAAREVL